MIGLGIVLATAGYGLVVYGARLWSGDPESLAYLFGFSSTNSAAKPKAAPGKAPSASVIAAAGQSGGGHGVR
jgi:hypothetical protein